MLGVIGGLTVVVSLAFIVFAILDVAGKLDERYPATLRQMWRVVIVLAVGYEAAPWVVSYAA